jgi:peptidoglycan hydrolase CwlO-like protein
MRRRSAAGTFILIVLSLSLLAAPLAQAATKSDLQAHEKAAADARAAAKAAEAAAAKLAIDIEALEVRMTAIEKDIAALADDIGAASLRTDKLQLEVDGLRGEVTLKQAEIDATQAECDSEEALLAARMQETYKQGDLFFLEMLLSSNDIEDLIARTALAQRVMTQNQENAAQLKETRLSLDKVKSEMDRTLEAVDTKRAEAKAEEDRLLGLRSQRKARLADQQAAENEKSALFTANKKEAARLRALADAEDAESAKIAQELYGTGSGYYSGVMAWPVPGYFRISSPFGPRICPFHGRENHSGIDIGRKADGTAIGGAAIVAAGGGTVLSAGWRGGLVTPSSSTTATASRRSTRTSRLAASRFPPAKPSPRVIASEPSVQRATRRARTCTSRCA